MDETGQRDCGVTGLRSLVLGPGRRGGRLAGIFVPFARRRFARSSGSFFVARSTSRLHLGAESILERARQRGGGRCALRSGGAIARSGTSDFRSTALPRNASIPEWGKRHPSAAVRAKPNSASDTASASTSDGARSDRLCSVQPMDSSKSLHACSQRLHTWAQIRQCSWCSAWRSHSLRQALHVTTHASTAARTTPTSDAVWRVTMRPVDSHRSAQSRQRRMQRTNSCRSLSPRSASAQLVHVAAQSMQASIQRTTTSRSRLADCGCVSSISRIVTFPPSDVAGARRRMTTASSPGTRPCAKRGTPRAPASGFAREGTSGTARRNLDDRVDRSAAVAFTEFDKLSDRLTRETIEAEQRDEDSRQ